MPDKKRPNILFCIADDASHFGVYGHKFVKTPCIDRLAGEGITFTHAFTTNPKCAPSRASILTGRHTWQLREGCDHFGYFPDDFDVYPDLLEEAGYHVGFTGKGWSPGDFTRCGRTRNPAGDPYNTAELVPPDGSLIKPRDYAGNFDLFMDAKPDDSPFCFWYGCHEPHRPYKYGEGKKNGENPEEATVPPYWPDEESVKMDMADYAFEINWYDRQLEKIIGILEERGEKENTLIVVTSDNGAPFPRVKGQMYDDDFRLPLVIVPPGRSSGAGREDKLVSFTDFAPTFLDYAGISVPPDWAGMSLRPLLNGDEEEPFEERPFVLMGRERHDLGRENDAGYPVRCLRTPDYLYVWNMKPDRWPAGNPETGFTNCDSSPTKERILELKDEGETCYFDLAFAKRPEEELYHIASDRHCLKNLAGSGEFAELKNTLHRELEISLKDAEDPRSFGKGEEFDTYDYVGEDDHSWKALKEGRWKKQCF